MLFRVVLVTTFLGSALLVDARGFTEFSDTRNYTLVALIVGTYLLTIFHGLGLRKNLKTQTLAAAQIAGDLFITTLLVLATGGFDSLYLFFFHLTIINAAVVAGPRGAAYTAGATALAMIYFATITLGWVPHPILNLELGHVGPIGLTYEVAINSLAGALIAFLAGQLAERLGEATEELEQHKTDILDLKALNDNILASLSSGLLTVDLEGKIIFFNRAAEEITGLTSGQVLGQNLATLFPNLASASSTHKISISHEPRLESVFTRPEGTRIYLGFSVSSLRDGQGNKSGKIIIFQDLSEIRKLEAQMKRSEKLAAVGELSASIAHEIRNPLASISGSVEMLRADLDEESSPDEKALLMTIILREVDRLNLLITDFLAYSQPQKLNRRPTNLITITQEILQLFRVQADLLNIKTTLESDPEVQVLVDPESLRQILWNLLKNASEAFTDKETAHREILVQIYGDPRENWGILAVEDSGPGVPTSKQDQIFQPFFTTKESGTGLGLATIFRLIEEQKGLLLLEKPQTLAGARFEVRLPLVSQGGQDRQDSEHSTERKNEETSFQSAELSA